MIASTAVSGRHAGRSLAGGAPGVGALAGRAVRTVPGVAAAGYLASWIAGLSVPAPGPAFSAPGTAIVAADAGHQGAVTAAYALTE
jgi:hypothetical protein